MNEPNQLNFIYNGIDIEIRVEDLRRSRETTTLKEYLKELLPL